MEKSKTSQILSEKEHLFNRLLIEGLIVGILAGIVAIIYRLMLSQAESFLFNCISYIKTHSTYIILWFAFLVVLAFFI